MYWSENMEFNRKNMTRLFLLSACVILFYLSFKHMDIVFSFIGWLMGVLTPFIIAGVVIILMNVPLKLIERFLFRPRDGKPVSPVKEKLRRPIAIVLSISIYLAVIAVFLIIIIPEISKSLMAIAEKIPAVIDSLQKWLIELSEQEDFIGSIAQQIKANIEWDKLNSTLVNFLQDNSTTLVSSAWTIITSIINVALNLFLGIVLAIYVLAKKEKIASDVKRFIYSVLSTKKADFIVEVGQLTNRSFYNSITGQMMECVIIGLLTAFGMSIFGFPYAALGGVVVAITSWIPMFGIFIGSAIVSLLLLATGGPMQAIWFIIYMVVLQQIEGNLIFPRVVGSRIGLPPIIMISAIVLFSAFFGIIGLLVCGPVTYVIFTLSKRVVASRLEKKKIPEEKYAPIYDYNEEEEQQRREQKKASSSSGFKCFGFTFKRNNGKIRISPADDDGSVSPAAAESADKRGDDEKEAPAAETDKAASENEESDDTGSSAEPAVQTQKNTQAHADNDRSRKRGGARYRKKK